MFAMPWEDVVIRRLEVFKWRYLKILFSDTLDASFGSWTERGVCRQKQTFSRTAYCWGHLSRHSLYGGQGVIAI